MLRIKHTTPISEIKSCGCVLDSDPDTVGLLIRVCEEHHHPEWGIRRLMDAEIDSVVRGTRPRSRPFGVIGNFLVAK